MADKWMYRLLNEEFGPIVEDQVVDLIRSQILAGPDEIRSEDSTLWQTLNDVAVFRNELDQDSSQHLDVAESLDDLSFEFGESSSPDDDAPPSRTRQQHAPAGRHEQSVGRDGFGRAGQLRQAASDEPQLLQSAEVDSTGFELNVNKPEKIRQTTPVPVHVTTQQGIPAQRVSSAPAESRKPRRRKSAPHDPLMEEIARELAERGKSGAPSPASAVSPLSAFSTAPSVSPVSAPASGFDVNDSTDATRPSSAFVRSASPSASPLMSQPSMSRPAAMAPGVASHSKSFSSVRPPTGHKNRSLEMPEPKTIGIAGGVVAAALLVAAYSFGWISFPFGSSGGSLPGNAGAVVSCYLEYKQFGSAIPGGEDWTAFRSSVEKNVKPVVESSADSKDNVSEAARKLMELARLEPQGNPEKLQKIVGELDTLVAEITGTN